MLCKTKEALDREQRLTAYFVPPMDFNESFECLSHSKCRKAWRDVWWKKVGKKLLHPDNPLPYEEAAAFVAEMDWGAVDISACCKQEIVERVKDSVVFSNESVSADIVKTAIDAIIAFNKSLG